MFYIQHCTLYIQCTVHVHVVIKNKETRLLNMFNKQHTCIYMYLTCYIYMYIYL